MIIFTTIEHLKRRGIPGSLTRRYGKDYHIVTIGAADLEEVRRSTGKKTSQRIVATVGSRDEVAAWISGYDQPGTAWPKYVFEGL